jgi:single-strand DNA-binding protein
VLPSVTGEFRCGADPELRFAPSGVAVCKVRAVASSRKKVNDEWVDDKTTWVNLVGFKRTAENMAETLAKGYLVTVTGRLQVENWEDNEGNKRTSVDVILDSIGPSLSFVAAKVQASERSSTGSGGSGGGGGSSPDEDPWAAPTGQTEEPPF